MLHFNAFFNTLSISTPSIKSYLKLVKEIITYALKIFTSIHFYVDEQKSAEWIFWKPERISLKRGSTKSPSNPSGWRLHGWLPCGCQVHSLVKKQDYPGCMFPLGPSIQKQNQSKLQHSQFNSGSEVSPLFKLLR